MNKLVFTIVGLAGIFYVIKKSSKIENDSKLENTYASDAEIEACLMEFD